MIASRLCCSTRSPITREGDWSKPENEIRCWKYGQDCLVFGQTSEAKHLPAGIGKGADSNDFRNWRKGLCGGTAFAQGSQVRVFDIFATVTKSGRKSGSLNHAPHTSPPVQLPDFLRPLLCVLEVSRCAQNPCSFSCKWGIFVFAGV